MADWMEQLTHVRFANAAALWLLLLLPVVVVVYLRMQKKRWQQAYRFSALSVAEHLRHAPSPWKRLLPPLMMLLVLVLLIVSMARPMVISRVAVRSVDMMLVMDISLSMLAADIKPNRITAAREAGIKFVQSLPDDVRVGLELFAGENWVAAPPTRDHRQVVALLRDLSEDRLRQRTQLGGAIQAALNVLSASDEAQGENDKQKPQKVIILLSDGDSQEGYPWSVAANNARQQNVTVHTVGIGSAEPTTIIYQGTTLPVSFDETTLKRIAQIAGGDYFRVFSETDFKTVYDQVRDKSIHYEEKPEELSWLLSALALGLLAISGLLQSIWIRRL